jgi:hypothetical protein
MRRTFIAAATLLLGTSALAAGTTTQDKFDKTAVETDPIILAKYQQAAALKNGGAGMGGPVEEFSSISDKGVIGNASDPVILAKHEQGAAMKTSQAFTGTGGPSEELSSVSDKTVVGDANDPVILAKHQQAAAMKLGQLETGMGGPVDGADAADSTPRPATRDYPPCDPGPGDDRCIQLYEPGVRAQRASWSRASGGAGDGAWTAAAVGGSYERLDGSADGTELAMNGDVPVASAFVGKSEDGQDIVRHSEFSGVGGPIEAQSGYPACSPGAGDDSCIQLYEVGVTGAGN